MFMFFQIDNFSFSNHKLDQQGDPQSTIFSTSLTRKQSQEYIFSEFIDKFVYTSTCFIKWLACSKDQWRNSKGFVVQWTCQNMGLVPLPIIHRD